MVLSPIPFRKGYSYQYQFVSKIRGLHTLGYVYMMQKILLQFRTIMEPNALYSQLIKNALLTPDSPLPAEKTHELIEKSRTVSIRNYRLQWFNSVDRKLLRLVVPSHHCIASVRKCCVLCGGKNDVIDLK